MEFRQGRWLLSGELYQGLADQGGVGGALRASWRFSDLWRFEALAEFDSQEAPLRGIGRGISADRFGVGAEYTLNESQRARLAYDFFDFDDENLRHSARAQIERRILNWPHYKLTAFIDLYGSMNRNSDVIYYSPNKDFSWTVTIDNDWRLYRRYERSFSHRLLASVGRYHEEDFTPGTTWSFAYEHAWQLSNAFKFTYGIMRSRRVFDGKPEFENAVYGNLNLRF